MSVCSGSGMRADSRVASGESNRQSSTFVRVRGEQGEVHADAGPRCAERDRDGRATLSRVAELQALCRMNRVYDVRMLRLILAVMACSGAGAAAATFISADEMCGAEAVDCQQRHRPADQGDRDARRTQSRSRCCTNQAETIALVHDHVTEIYQIMEGSGTFVTGGALQTPRARSHSRERRDEPTGRTFGGESRRVRAKDVSSCRQEMAHRFSQLDGPITYLVYRFAPKR